MVTKSNHFCNAKIIKCKFFKNFLRRLASAVDMNYELLLRLYALTPVRYYAFTLRQSFLFFPISVAKHYFKTELYANIIIVFTACRKLTIFVFLG